MKRDSYPAAVVTGGASGLGRATAEALAAAGVKVAIFDINDALGEEVAQSIGGLFVHVDITDEQSVLDGFAKARAAHGQRSEEHTSELQSLMRISYPVFCLKKKKLFRLLKRLTRRACLLLCLLFISPQFLS